MTGRPWSLRIVRALLRLLPGEFRGDFADQMAADLDASAPKDAASWRREVRSLAGAVVREHLDALRQDVTYALRTMRRTPGFTAMAVAMLALGTGVNVAIFSIVDAVLLRSPFTDPDRVVAVRAVENGRATFAVPLTRYRELLGAPGPLAAVAAFGGGSHILTGQGDPINVDDIECVSWNMFGVLGTSPMIGRTFGPDEDHPGAAPTIVLSFDFWRRLGGSTAILGTPLTINQTPVTVIGVMPKGFAGPLARGDVQGWLPLSRPVQSAHSAGCREGSFVNVVGRLADGLTVGAVAQAMPGITLGSLESPVVEDVRTPLVVLSVAVSCVLLIASLNVGGLQMERTLARRREMALRLAIGASRGRLVRQTLTENLCLALVGAAAGVASAALTLQALVSLVPGNVPYRGEIAINVRVLVVAIAVAVAAGLIAGLLPLAEARLVSPIRDLVDAARASEPRASWQRRSLVVAEIALTVVVLIGAALMVQTYLTLRPTRPGFDPTNKLVMSVRVRGETPDASAQFFSQLFERLRATPGVRGAAGSTSVPMSGNTAMASIALGETTTDVRTNYVTPGFFTLLRIPLVGGRQFTSDDTRESLPVVIVNELLASRIRADGHVVGQSILVQSQGATAPVERTIVGVLGNTRNSGIDTLPRAEAFVPYAQFPVAYQHVVVEAEAGRSADVAGAIRGAVRALRPDLVVARPEPLLALITRRMGALPFGAWLLGLVAALAVGLSAIGLTATIGWWVRQRTRELGVRIALGATPGRVTTLVLRQGMSLAVLGIGAGCLGAAGLTRYLAEWIYGVTPLDPASFAAAAALMLGAAAVAVYVPVRRAASVDPVVALRAE